MDTAPTRGTGGVCTRRASSGVSTHPRRCAARRKSGVKTSEETRSIAKRVRYVFIGVRDRARLLSFSVERGSGRLPRPRHELFVELPGAAAHDLQGGLAPGAPASSAATARGDGGG